MSFSYQVKEELCRTPVSKKNAAVSECLGVALYCNAFRKDLLRVVTGNEAFCARLPLLFGKAFGLSFDTSSGEKQERGKYVFELSNEQSLSVLREAFSLAADEPMHLNFNILEDDICAAAFLRGAFLAGGSVTDPGKSYHLELSTTHAKVNREVYALLRDCEFFPKETQRNGGYVLYFKQSDYIEDFLTTIGAPVSAMGIMEAKVEKGLVNNINRRVNCETANLTKVVDAAQEQISAIHRLQERDILRTLPAKLQETAQLRLDNPEATLTELAEMCNPPMTKSAINHRMRKLTELSKE